MKWFIFMHAKIIKVDIMILFGAAAIDKKWTVQRIKILQLSHKHEQIDFANGINMEKIYKRLSLLTIERIQRYETYIKVFAKTKYHPHECPKCLSSRICIHSVNEVRFVDLPYKKKTTYLYVKKKRYKCKSCCKTFFESVPHTLPFNRMTTFFAEHLYEEYNKMSCRKLSSLMKVDIKTINNLMRHVIEGAKTVNQDVSSTGFYS